MTLQMASFHARDRLLGLLLPVSFQTTCFCPSIRLRGSRPPTALRSCRFSSRCLPVTFQITSVHALDLLDGPLFMPVTL